MSILGSVLYGLANLLHPRMLWLMIWPMLVSLVVWGAVAVALWTRVALWLAELMRRWLEPAAGFVRLDFGDATLIAAHVVLFLLFVPLVYITALFIPACSACRKWSTTSRRARFPRSSAGAAAARRVAPGTAWWRSPAWRPCSRSACLCGFCLRCGRSSRS
jgi:hypothetical protein